MKILGNPTGPVSSITLRLNSIKTKLRHYFNPFRDPYSDSVPCNKGDIEIVFEDSYEVDNLINMLEDFKKQNRGYIGEWR